MSVCFLGGTRYSQPLDGTSEKKFRVLETLGESFVIAFSRDLRPRRFTQHAHFYLLPKLPTPVLRYAEMFTITPILVLWLVLRHRVQVLVAQSPYEGLAAALAKKVANWFGRKIVLVVESHGDFEQSLFLQRRILLPGLYRFLMRRAACFTLRHADLLRAVSNFTREQLARWAPGKPIFQFPTWTDIDVFLQAALDKNEGSFQDILYAGVLTPLKGVHHLVNAFACVAKDFPQARLVIVGQQEDKTYSAGLKEQARRIGLDGHVQFVGEVAQREVARYMAHTRAVVLPSLSEGLPRVGIEAMACGTRVIGSRVGGIPEMIEDGITGFLVPPGNEAVLADQLRWVLEHPGEACEMGRRARAFAKQFFSTEAYVRGYRQLFDAAQALMTEQGERAHSTV